MHSLADWLSPEAQSGGLATITSYVQGTAMGGPALWPPRLCILRQPWNLTVHPATTAGPDCAYCVIREAILCIRRQPRSHTVHLATASAPKQPLAVARCTVWLAACRRGHNLAHPPMGPQAVSTSHRYTKWRPGAEARRPLGPSVRAVRYSATGPAARTSSDISGYFAAALSTNILATR